MQVVIGNAMLGAKIAHLRGKILRAAYIDSAAPDVPQPTPKQLAWLRRRVSVHPKRRCNSRHVRCGVNALSVSCRPK